MGIRQDQWSTANDCSWFPGRPNGKRLHEYHGLKVHERKNSGGHRNARKERAPDVDWVTDRVYDRRFLQDQRRTWRKPLA